MIQLWIEYFRRKHNCVGSQHFLWYHIQVEAPHVDRNMSITLVRLFSCKCSLLFLHFTDSVDRIIWDTDSETEPNFRFPKEKVIGTSNGLCFSVCICVFLSLSLLVSPSLRLYHRLFSLRWSSGGDWKSTSFLNKASIVLCFFSWTLSLYLQFCFYLSLPIVHNLPFRSVECLCLSHHAPESFSGSRIFILITQHQSHSPNLAIYLITSTRFLFSSIYVDLFPFIYFDPFRD